MSYFAKFEHLIGDKPVPYEVPCDLVTSDGVKSVVAILMASTGMVKYRTVDDDKVYFKLESV